MNWRQRSIPRRPSARLLAHLDAERNRREDWEAEVDAVIVDESLLEGNNVPIDANPNVIHSMCKFSERDFFRLYDTVEDRWRI
jgi:hypothetical protein